MGSWRRDKIVFIDPDDGKFPYWWPALVVTPEEMDKFREKMGANPGRLKSGEQLVCYFEDGSYSTVRDTDMLSFCPDEEPYKSYLASSFKEQFLNDKGIVMANKYWQTGEIPGHFKWLKK